MPKKSAAHVARAVMAAPATVLVLTVVVIYTLLLAAVIFVKSDLSERFNDRHRKQ